MLKPYHVVISSKSLFCCSCKVPKDEPEPDKEAKPEQEMKGSEKLDGMPATT